MTQYSFKLIIFIKSYHTVSQANLFGISIFITIWVNVGIISTVLKGCSHRGHLYLWLPHHQVRGHAMTIGTVLVGYQEGEYFCSLMSLFFILHISINKHETFPISPVTWYCHTREKPIIARCRNNIETLGNHTIYMGPNQICGMASCILWESWEWGIRYQNGKDAQTWGIFPLGSYNIIALPF